VAFRPLSATTKLSAGEIESGNNDGRQCAVIRKSAPGGTVGSVPQKNTFTHAPFLHACWPAVRHIFEKFSAQPADVRLELLQGFQNPRSRAAPRKILSRRIGNGRRANQLFKLIWDAIGTRNSGRPRTHDKPTMPETTSRYARYPHRCARPRDSRAVLALTKQCMGLQMQGWNDSNLGGEKSFGSNYCGISCTRSKIFHQPRVLGSLQWVCEARRATVHRLHWLAHELAGYDGSDHARDYQGAVRVMAKPAPWRRICELPSLYLRPVLEVEHESLIRR